MAALAGISERMNMFILLIFYIDDVVNCPPALISKIDGTAAFVSEAWLDADIPKLFKLGGNSGYGWWWELWGFHNGFHWKLFALRIEQP